ncbi:MAG: cytochrome c3 family protein [bacterium]
MGTHYESWKHSTHKEVKCQQCHTLPALADMITVHFSRKDKDWQIAGNVPDTNCRKCHTETRNLIVYHSLKITHKQHWDMGTSCTFCHSNVVHGPRSIYKNTPSMETCYKCHDGKQASNACTVCHTTLGERRPIAFNPEWVEAHKFDIQQNRSTCKRCHSEEFCKYCHMSANPHRGNWLRVHDVESKKETKKCSVCHQEVYCAGCHKIKKAHELNWIDRHSQKAGAEPGTCRNCHDQNFCIECHSKLVTHPEDWVILHPLKVKEDPQTCHRCHTSDFCAGCHESKLPQNHKKEWLSNHGGTVSRDGATVAACITCHQTDFCQSCHKEIKPKSHGSNWSAVHGAGAKKNLTSCKLCHGENYCFSCHQVKIPHGDDWMTEHSAIVKDKGKAICLRCHEAEMCTTCHDM